MLVDSHCHLTDPQYDEDRWEVLARAQEAGVARVLSVCSNARDVQRVLDLVKRSRQLENGPEVWGSAGIHPHDAESAQEGDLEAVRDAATHHSEIVAVGETGLDFYYDHSPRRKQEGLFRDHLEIAAALDLPVVVHSRDADREMIQILEEWGHRTRGVLHCYTGGEELQRVALKVGWLISFTGIITFKKYHGQELIRSIPEDRLMVETDGPYLAPAPFRGRRNEPAFVRRISEVLAEIRGQDLSEVAGYTTRNAVRFFGLSE